MKWLVTRSQEECAPWQAEVQNDGLELIGISFLSFQMQPIEELPSCDWLLFTSKNGVKFFFEQWKKPITCKIAAIGKATAASIQAWSYTADFIPEGHIESALIDLNSVAKDQTIAWIKPLNSTMSVEEKLKDVKAIFPVVVYENTLDPKKVAIEWDGIVFTSPMNVDGFLLHNQIKNGTAIISIGPSTSKRLNGHGINKFHEMELPAMKNIIQQIKKINKT